MLQISKYSPSAFNDSATRAILSWLLIDGNAKRSFESIFRYFNTESHLDVSSGYKRWLFHFDPPQMSGWSFTYEGRLDASGNYLLVEKIIDIEINAPMPSRINFKPPAKFNLSGGFFMSDTNKLLNKKDQKRSCKERHGWTYTSFFLRK
ncbi:MAG: hypothetical protein QNK36_12240 [Colwellia sp.]|nr:hypothetical protein [Colwellia sp.]